MKMKNRIWIYSLLMLGVLIISTPGCNNADPPTPPVLAVLTTSALTNIGQNTATSGGTITSDGGAAVTARGVCWSTSPTPVLVDTPYSKSRDGAGSGNFSSSITALTANTTYYVRAYATNSAGTSYGNEMSFTTQPGEIATLTTSSISGIGQSLATCGGNVTSDGVSTVTRGVCWATVATPTINDSKTIDGTGTGIFSSSITGLTANTKYFVRAYATNNAGTGYGNELSFTTQQGETVTDIDGNVYNEVTIGTQVWMVENLKTTQYNDGTAIPLVADNTAWSILTTGGYCWAYNDEATFKNTYGALYNWYTINTKLCPTGWHVPNDA